MFFVVILWSLQCENKPP